MTTEAESQVEQEQTANAMLAGFEAIRNPGQERLEDDGKHEPSDSESDSDEYKQAGAEEQEAEEARFAGMTESEIRSLLERASKFDAFEDQLSKAHGKIGELNRTLQQLATNQQRPAQTASANSDTGDDEADTDFSEIDELFPELSPAVERKARKAAQDVLQQYQQQQNSGQQLTAVDPQVINQTVALAVMDATRPKWRETVTSGDFQKWIEAQPEDFRETYNTTWDTSVFSQIIDQFESARMAATERTTKSRTRLEAALTPDSRSSRVSHAATEMDAMQEGFNSVRNPRFYSARH